MHGNVSRQQECEEPVEQPGSKNQGEKPQKRGFRWPWRRWRGFRVSLFWNVGIKIVRPKRTVAARPTLVQGGDVKAITRSQETSA